jgi:hypothetical protein
MNGKKDFRRNLNTTGHTKRSAKSLGAYFGWKFFWGSKLEWHSHDRREATTGRHFREGVVPDRECGPCPVFALYLRTRLTAEEKSGKSISQGSRKMPAEHDSISRLGGRFTARLGSLSNLRHLRLTLRATRVTPRSGQISAELQN